MAATQSTELLQKFDDFRDEILRKLQSDLGTLRADIVFEMDSQASGSRRQTQLGRPSKMTGTKTSLANVLSKRLNDFASEFSQNLNREFKRRFSMLGSSRIATNSTVGGMADVPDPGHSGGSVALGQTAVGNNAREEFALGVQVSEDTPSSLASGPPATEVLRSSMSTLNFTSTTADNDPVRDNSNSESDGVDTSAETTTTGYLSASSHPTATEPSPKRGEQPSLNLQQLGENMVLSIMDLSGGGTLTAKVTVQDLGYTNWAELGQAIKPPKNYNLLAVQYAPGYGSQNFSELMLSSSTKFRFPDFSESVDKPSKDEIDRYLKELTSAPPNAPIPYYVGPPLTSDFDHLLHAGTELFQLGPIPGVNLPYWHAGERGSGTAFHCEDANMRSCNITLFGWKVWIFIRENHTIKFENFIKRFWTTSNNCNQFVRHHNLLFDPARLRQEHIEFEMHCAGPGDMIITAPRQYHAVINITTCFAVAINFSLPGEEVIPKGLPVCSECGLYPLKHPNFKVVPRRSDGEPNLSLTRESLRLKRTNINKTTGPVPRKALPVSSRKRQIEPLTGPGNKRHKQATSLAELAARLVHVNSVRRFMSHIASWRSTPINSDDFKVTGSLAQRAARYYVLSDKLKKSSTLCKLLSHLLDIQLADTLEKDKTQGYQRSPTNNIGNILQSSGIHDTPAARKRFQDRLKSPRKLTNVLGPYRGLLSFLPLDEDNTVTFADYRDMAQGDISSFHTLLKAKRFIPTLAKIGNLFQQSVLSCTRFPDMVWERIDTQELEKLDVEHLVELLEVQYRDENAIITPDWERPDGWLGDWPVNADSLPAGVQCDICSRKACICIQGYFPENPRISSYGRKGLGLQAIATGDRVVVYKKDQPIGEIVGCIVAPGKYKDGYALDLIRSDLVGEPTTGQIYTRRESNIFRFVNHRCRQPSAKVRGIAISQRYRMVIFASRDIVDGEEITVNWGSHLLLGRQCLCEDCTGA